MARVLAWFGTFERMLVRRSLTLWVLLRLMLAPVAARTAGSPLFISPTAALVVIATTVVVCWIATRRRFEDLMLANLGRAPWTIGLLMALPPLLLELLVARLDV